MKHIIKHVYDTAHEQIILPRHIEDQSVINHINMTRPKNALHFANEIFKLIFVNRNYCISNQISLTVVPKGP